MEKDPIEILIVEDSPVQAIKLHYTLESQGYRVSMARNGLEALVLLQQHQPTLVISDIVMPEMDGYELCRRLKGDERLKTIPLILLTTLSDPHDVVKALSSGADNFVTKPYQEEFLLSRIRHVLLNQELRRQSQNEAGVALFFDNQRYHFASEPVQMIDLLLSTFENAVQKNLELEEANQRLLTMQRELEQKNLELNRTLADLKATQEQLIESEKMAALGQLIAGVAHEINTPLGAIRSSIENISDFLGQQLPHLPAFFRQLSPERQQDFIALLQTGQRPISSSSRDKRAFRRQLCRQLAAAGVADADLTADILVDIGIYEEITPFLSLLQAEDKQAILDMSYHFFTLQKSTQTILTATDRAAKVVFALKTYAHYDTHEEKVKADITDGLETVLTIYDNKLKQGVEVTREYESLPPILCYPDELNQVWTNLIHNAIQAMSNKGSLTIRAWRSKAELGPTPGPVDCVAVSVGDDGRGIPPEIQPKIFEPFFTTNPPGEGSGLGLDIVRRIVEKHAGKIEVASVPGQTTFTVFLPIQPPA
jgi:signal transduction histidine kinase